MEPTTLNERVSLLRRVGHAVTADPAIPGTDPNEPLWALRGAGISQSIIEVIEEAEPPDATSLIDDLPACIGKTDRQRAALRYAGVYPLVLASMAIVAWLATRLVMIPSLQTLGFAMRSSAFVTVAVVPCLLILAGLVLATRIRKDPRLPLAGARAAQDTALVLSIAALLAKAEVSLTKALHAAAHLALSPVVRDDVTELANALDKNDPIPPLRSLLSPLSASLLGAAAGEGEGAAVLDALARVAEREARQRTQRAVSRIEVGSLVVAGTAVTIVAVGFMVSYGSSFGGAM